MRWTALLFAGLQVVAMSTHAFAQTHGAKTVDDAWIAAAKAGDVNALVALYAPDAVLYMPDSKEARGTAAIRKAYEDMLGAMKVTEVSIDSQYQTVAGLSVGYGTATLTMVPKAGGAPQTMTARVTAAAAMINGKWLYIVDHASVPVGPPPGAATKPSTP
jgi:uncharacterized protein (TIGR02246 family)